jgi:hypothetical protein
MGHPLVLVLVPVLNVAHAATGGNCRGTIAQGSADRQRAALAPNEWLETPKDRLLLLPFTRRENTEDGIVSGPLVPGHRPSGVASKVRTNCQRAGPQYEAAAVRLGADMVAGRHVSIPYAACG